MIFGHLCCICSYYLDNVAESYVEVVSSSINIERDNLFKTRWGSLCYE